MENCKKLLEMENCKNHLDMIQRYKNISSKH